MAEGSGLDDAKLVGTSAWTPTTCGGCYEDCAFLARVGDGGTLEVSMPVEGHPCCARRLCGRGRRRLSLPELEHDRVTHPLRRVGEGRFERVSWDEAYADIAARIHASIAAAGPNALALTCGVPSYHWRYAQRLLWSLGSPNIYTVDAACEASRLTGWLHTLGYSPESDLANTDYIVYLGRSPMDAASANMAEQVRQARERGATVVVVDPRRNSTVEYASRWLKVRPGHDLALLLGIAHVLVEEGLYDTDFVERHTTGFDEFARAMRPYTPDWAAREADVDAADVIDVARGLAVARPRAVVDCGFHGGLGVAYANSTQTARMIACIDALLGSFGRVGASLNPQAHIELGELDPALFKSPERPALAKTGANRYPMVDPARGLCTTIGESIELGEIRALVAYASNPASGYGNARDWMRMLGGLDVLVTVDIRMSETARISDYVLPEVSYLEADRGVGAMGDALYYRGRVLDVRHPDTRPADRIFSELAQALGVGEYFEFSPDDLARAQVAPFGVDLDELKRTGYASVGAPPQNRTGEPVILAPDGKFPFVSDEWENVGHGRAPKWMPPLVNPGPDEFRLISGNNPFASHTSERVFEGAERSRTGLDYDKEHLPERGDKPHAPGSSHDALHAVWINASRAREMGVCDGDIVEVSSSEGTDRAVAHITDDLHPDALFTTASPGARSGAHARARAAVEGALGVGPLDHTPLRTDALSGAALTQENVVRVRKVLV